MQEDQHFISVPPVHRLSFYPGTDYNWRREKNPLPTVYGAFQSTEYAPDPDGFLAPATPTELNWWCTTDDQTLTSTNSTHPHSSLPSAYWELTKR